MKKVGILLVLALFLFGCATNEKEDAEKKDTEEEVEQTEETEVEDSKVVTIADKTFDDDDFEFHTLMNQLKLVLEIDQTEDEDKIEYLEEQREYYEKVNVNLQDMIELYAASLLAEEKNYFVPDEDLLKEVEAYKEKVADVPEAEDLVEEYGEEKFNRNIEEYIRQTVLRDRVAEELEEEVREDNPEAEDDEINFLLEQEFEDLLIDQVYSLEMEIHLK